jgi:excisionase family DNA binding protein
MTIREAAAELGLSESKTRSLCRARLIEHYRYGDRYVITAEQLERYRASCLVEAKPNEAKIKWMDYLSSRSRQPTASSRSARGHRSSGAS